VTHSQRLWPFKTPNVTAQRPDNLSQEYRYSSAAPTWSNNYLWKPVRRILLSGDVPGRTVLEIGCGNGATAHMIRLLGFEVTGIDPSISGIEIASASYPGIHFAEGSAYDDLAAKYGRFACVVSLEVVEHCYWPRRFAKTVHDLLEPGGVGIISTPYHGYTKNLALALAGKFDRHWAPLWDGGHIKFWSRKTLGQLFGETGFSSVACIRVGRIPALAKSMIAVVRKA
jgi:2-polyprenyl-3-methyl-5-hydroxy-6-metoxy-1,4-benzoquinol methylase